MSSPYGYANVTRSSCRLPLVHGRRSQLERDSGIIVLDLSNPALLIVSNEVSSTTTGWRVE